MEYLKQLTPFSCSRSACLCVVAKVIAPEILPGWLRAGNKRRTLSATPTHGERDPLADIFDRSAPRGHDPRSRLSPQNLKLVAGYFQLREERTVGRLPHREKEAMLCYHSTVQYNTIQVQCLYLFVVVVKELLTHTKQDEQPCECTTNGPRKNIGVVVTRSRSVQ
jgi:hypothetical protein